MCVFQIPLNTEDLSLSWSDRHWYSSTELFTSDITFTNNQSEKWNKHVLVKSFLFLKASWIIFPRTWIVCLLLFQDEIALNICLCICVYMHVVRLFGLNKKATDMMVRHSGTGLLHCQGVLAMLVKMFEWYWLLSKNLLLYFIYKSRPSISNTGSTRQPAQPLPRKVVPHM